jgi:Ca2+-transporting ATPase
MLGAVTVSHIYKLTKEQLRKMFDPNCTSVQTQLEYLAEYGNMPGLLKKLASDANTGIIGDKKDLQRREKVFGKNKKPLPETPGLLDSIKQEAQNRLWWVVGGSAVLSGFCGAFTITGAPWYMGLIEGASIIIAAMFIMLVSSVADMTKDKRFVKLLDMNKEETVAVIRGKFGATQSISMWDLVVGDIVLLSSGTRVPADCIVIESSDLWVTSKDGQKVNKEAAPSPKEGDEL